MCATIIPYKIDNNFHLSSFHVNIFSYFSIYSLIEEFEKQKKSLMTIKTQRVGFIFLISRIVCMKFGKYIWDLPIIIVFYIYVEISRLLRVLHTVDM